MVLSNIIRFALLRSWTKFTISLALINIHKTTSHLELVELLYDRHMNMNAPSELISTRVALLYRKLTPFFRKSSFFVQTLSISAVEFMRARGNRNCDQTVIHIRGFTKFLHQAFGLKFHWHLMTLSLKFQKARTKVEVSLVSTPLAVSAKLRQENINFACSLLEF